MMKKHIGFLGALAFVVLTAASAAFGQQTGLVKTDLSQAEVDRIVKAFTANEGEFREALKIYAFDRSATVHTIGMGGQVTGVYRRDSFMTFNSEGARFERITYFPVPTIRELTITPADIEDLGGVNPFALEPQFISLYNFTYVGKEKIDDLDLYVFDVSPKVMPDAKKTKQRFFTGRVWVDDRDLMIVKSKGKGLPEDKNNKYPVVETWRENVDGKYWFPSISLADDELVFDKGYSVKMRMKVKYENYRIGRSDVRIVEDEDVPAEPTPSPTPKKP
ncbi:MAG TPA: hypothetical protein DDW24_12800 [Blastocatellia bacterium]|nr:hypothetical protein [Blastocatellia bacterium]